MMKQEEIIQILKNIDPELKITQPRISRIVNGKEDISYPLAVALNALFPEKTVKEWKLSPGADFEQAFGRLKEAAA